MPRLPQPINQLIPQVLPIRVRVFHSRQYLRPSDPQRRVVHRGNHAAWALPSPSDHSNTAETNMEGYQ
jgi:hypothetical protein